MEQLYEKFLPIGTIVMLKGGKKRLMITGFCIIPESEKGKMYDYCGCLYPEGIISTDQIAVFNHDQIERVYNNAYIDEEEKTFKQKLKEELQKNAK